MKTLHSILIIAALCTATLTGCKKFLEDKPLSSRVLPESLQDLQALLDNYMDINRTGTAVQECSSDDYFLNNQDFLAVNGESQRLYTWQNNNLFPGLTNDWTRAYDRVFIANVVLDNIVNIEKNVANAVEWDDVKAQALFCRAFAFFEIAQIWALAYDANTAATDLGIPLRLKSDINEKISRSTLQQTYDKILADLNDAVSLAKGQPLHTYRSSKPAIYALLARTYLAMRDYENCRKYADMCLQLKNSLLDFNNNPPLNPNATFPFNNTALVYNNPEIIYASRMTTPSVLANARAKMDSLLYDSYRTGDLRKLVYFKNNNNKTFGFKGSLEGSQFLFNGIAVDEVYLMRAECYARKGMITEAMADLNTLMIKRWNKNVAYQAFTAANANEALDHVLKERRKELLMRGLRWMDIKRLNKEGANITLKRIINGQTYTLAPNDNRYALALPEKIIDISGMPQNPK